MRKYILIFLLFLFLSSLFLHFQFPGSYSWIRMDIPHTDRIEQITLNSKGDIFALCYRLISDSLMGGYTYKIYRNKSSNNEWIPVYDNWALTFIAIYSDTIYIAAFNRIYLSNDLGESWTTLVDTLPVSFIHTFAKAPNGNIYIGANNTNYCSKDNGKSWSKLNLDYQAKCFLFLDEGIILTGVSSGDFPDPPQYIYRSSDNGSSWSKVLNAEKTSGWSIVQNNEGTLFAATSEYDSTNGGIYKSDDKGKNWVRVNNDLPSRKVNSLVINSTGTLFLSIEDKGLFYSTNSGENWNVINEGLSDLKIQTLSIDSNDKLYIGTSSENDTASILYCSTNTSVPEIKNISVTDFEVKQNYPNPFNPITTIEYAISSPSIVKIKIYNVKGEELFTLQNKKMETGNHKIKFNSSDLPSGIYFYRIENGRYSIAKKMVLLK